jgi:hypothetical protein
MWQASDGVPCSSNIPQSLCRSTLYQAPIPGRFPVAAGRTWNDPFGDGPARSHLTKGDTEGGMRLPLVWMQGCVLVVASMFPNPGRFATREERNPASLGVTCTQTSRDLSRQAEVLVSIHKRLLLQQFPAIADEEILCTALPILAACLKRLVI